MKEGWETPAARIGYTFRLAVARDPTPAERDVLVAAYERLRKQYAADRPAAEQVVSQGEKPRDPKLDVAELAAYAGVASVILNTDEALTRE